MLKHHVCSILALSFLVGCTTKTTVTSGDDPNSPTYQGPKETDYCSTSISYSGPTVTISGSAEYLRREFWGDSSTGGLGGATTVSTHPATLNPIRYAEVRVTGPNGAVAQCATTSGTGTFSFALPTSSSNVYTVYVNSRSSNAFLVASVLNRPTYNQFYSLSTTVTPNVTKTLATLTAPANGTVVGAAFNILDQLVKANEYIRSKAGTCSFAGCTGFTVAPKVSAYWTAGYNPNEYFGSPNSGLSFYLPGYSRLFILGGINGNTDNSDTDHFDNSVVIHEYGHFLEDVVFESDSPGGSHNGNKVIDPRLAWSEGWGNFFQAAVRNESHYIDTLGNDDGATSMAFYVDLESIDGHDSPLFDGEGNFREFAVTRTLWDIIDTNPDIANLATDNISDKFVEIWASLTRTSNSFKASNMAFRNIGLLYLIQKNLQNNEGASDWSSVLANNRQKGDESDYAQYVTTGACGTRPYSFPKSGATYASGTGSLSTSDLFRNNAFYHIRFASAGSHTIVLDSLDNGAGVEKDLDLYVYNRSARLGTTSDMVGFSHGSPDGTKGTSESETVTANFPAGDYLINVNVFASGAPVGQVDYAIKLDGVTLCPANLVPP